MDENYQFVNMYFGDGIQADSLALSNAPDEYLYNCPGIYDLSITSFTGTVCQNTDSSGISITVKPPIMEINSVSVNDEENIDIEWNLETTPSYYKSFRLYRKTDEGNWNSILSTGYPTRSYSDNNVQVHENIYYYYLATQEDCDEPVESRIHNSILLEAEYSEDPIAANLVWNSYEGWENGVGTYEIEQSRDEGVFQSIHESSDTEFMNAYDDVGFTHCFRILATDVDGKYFSFSNKRCLEFIPRVRTFNIITPNGDNMNDVFHIENISQYPDSELTIISRNGKSVYYRKGYQNDWSGEIGQKMLPAGVYYYHLDLNDSRPDKAIFRGILTIMH